LLTVMFGVSCLLAFIFYFLLACTNPGFIIGSGKDVERKAGAYDPKDYQI